MSTFADLGLSEKVLKAVQAVGYNEPTPIQAGAIPEVVQGKDVLGIAQTGTGKTAGFVLPMITRLERGRARARMPRTLIVEPTRELAAQVDENFQKYGANHKLNVALLIGGVSFDEQERKLERGADVLIATPGRLLDHFQRGKLLLTGVEILVIDEADRMLDMGFIPDIEKIVSLIPFTRQTLFFSATMPPEIKRLADQFLQAPVRVEVARASSTATTVEQRVLVTGTKDFEKREALRELIRAQDDLKNGIIFCNRKRDVATLWKSLEKHGFSCGALHGDMDQRARTLMLQGFKDNKIQLLVASDVAARGLDIPDVSHVFNFDAPIHAEDYVHRIGRTGRAGRSGKAFTLVDKSSRKFLDAIEALIQTKIEELALEGVSAPAANEASESDEKRGRSKRGGKGRRARSGDGDDKKAAETEAVQPADAAAPEESEKPSRRERIREDNAERKAQGSDTAAESEQPRSRRERPDRNRDTSERNPRHERAERQSRREPVPVGFGEDVPDFMMIGR